MLDTQGMTVTQHMTVTQNKSGTRQPDDDALLTVADLTREWNIGRATFYRWRANGEGPPAITICGRLRFRRRDVEAWLAAHTEQRSGAA